MHSPIYLDYAATTPVAKEVASEMANYLTKDGNFGNSSSSHIYGQQANNTIEISRKIISDFLKCCSEDIVFTSGATESNNLAIKGMARAMKDKGNHIITSATEHKAVLDTCRALEKEGFNITYLRPNADGLIASNQLKQAIMPETILASLMHVNNETGVIQNIHSLGNILKNQGILFHVDAAQSLGKLPIDLSTSPIDLISFSSHKIYGPKGIGALYIRNRRGTKIDSIINGGGHEFGIRPGTLATHQVVGFGKAIEIANKSIDEDYKHALLLRQKILGRLNQLNDIYIIGQESSCLPNILNICFLGVESSILITSLQNDVALSSGSACSSGSIEPSHVLKAMCLDNNKLNSAIRISFGRYNSEEDIDIALDKIVNEIKRIKTILN